MKPYFRDSQKAFQSAINKGALSESPTACNFAGDYMYMDSGYDGKTDNFKHCDTKRYLKVALTLMERLEVV